MIHSPPSSASNKFWRFYLQHEGECWKLIKRENLGSDKDDWHVADFYDGDKRESLLAQAVCNWLNANMP